MSSDASTGGEIEKVKPTPSPLPPPPQQPSRLARVQERIAATEQSEQEGVSSEYTPDGRKVGVTFLDGTSSESDHLEVTDYLNFGFLSSEITTDKTGLFKVRQEKGRQQWCRMGFGNPSNADGTPHDSPPQSGLRCQVSGCAHGGGSSWWWKAVAFP